MSSSLDDRLRELFAKPHTNSMGVTVMEFPTQKTLDNVKQIFADEGYQKPQIFSSNTTANFSEWNGGGYTNIPDWAARFETELGKFHADGIDGAKKAWPWAFKAAQRASNIEGNK